MICIFWAFYLILSKIRILNLMNDPMEKFIMTYTIQCNFLIKNEKRYYLLH